MRRKRSKPRNWEDRHSRFSQLCHQPFCQLCLLHGRSSPAVEADHMLGRGWIGADDYRSLLSVCRPCHEMVESRPDGTWLRLAAKWHTEGVLDLEFLELGSHTLLRGRLKDWLISWDHPVAARMLEWLDGPPQSVPV